MQGKTMTIDFVSTRNGVDVQSQRCAKLIASIIAQALTDLTVKPTPKERIGKININADAVRSIRFFQSETFFQYAALVGFDGKEFLDRITVGGTTTEYNGKEWVTKLRVIPKNYISEMGLRTIRARMRWRCSEHTPLLPTSEEDVADEIAWDLEEAQLKEKTITGRAVNMRLTLTEFTEYQRLGGIKWIRKFLQQSVEMQKYLELEDYDKKTKKTIKQNLRYHTKNIESRGVEEMVAFPQSKWAIVGELTQKTNR